MYLSGLWPNWLARWRGKGGILFCLVGSHFLMINREEVLAVLMLGF